MRLHNTTQISDLDEQMNEKLIRVKRKDKPISEIEIGPPMCICNECPGMILFIYSFTIRKTIANLIYAKQKNICSR